MSLREDETGWRVGETETHFIEIMPTLYNDRLVLTPKRSPMTYDRYWCYPRGPAAFMAAFAWDSSEETEPPGWIKSWDQRRHDPRPIPRLDECRMG
ncbi:hypothetical protein V6N00_13830 [Tersicoccus sp. MR15.9]|uniref:hypothetical protein n=1 Tax=Tersicoccus mangrovi TaxID=3121635 RepID=UPI002FE537C0